MAQKDTEQNTENDKKGKDRQLQKCADKRLTGRASKSVANAG